MTLHAKFQGLSQRGWSGQIASLTHEFLSFSFVIVNVCSLDMAKAFDKMNYHGLFIKLMERQIPIKTLCIL